MKGASEVGGRWLERICVLCQMISSSTDELLYVEIKGHHEDLHQISAII